MHLQLKPKRRRGKGANAQKGVRDAVHSIDDRNRGICVSDSLVG